MTTTGVMMEQETPAKGFALELSDKIVPLRAALRRMMNELGSPKSAQDLHRLSGASRTICWQVFRIVSADEVASEARRAPTPSSLKPLLAAASASGVSRQTIKAVESTAEEFRAFSKRAAGDRTAFDSMLGGISGEEGGGKILLSQRRAAYRANSHIAGVQTDFLYFGVILRRSESGDTIDSVGFNVHQGVRRLRPDAKVTLFGYQNPGATALPQKALDEEAAKVYGMPVLPQFSTNPLPRIEKVVLPSSGWQLFNTVGHEVGQPGSINCAFAQPAFAVPFSTDVDGRRYFGQTFYHVRKPVAMTVQEILLHRDSFPNIRPELLVYQYSVGDHSQEGARQAQKYPLDERLIKVGRADTVDLAEMPKYAELLRTGADYANWDLSEFDVYRVRMAYPIMYSAVRIFFYVD
jgi:hypothetical protein